MPCQALPGNEACKRVRSQVKSEKRRVTTAVSFWKVGRVVRMQTVYTACAPMPSPTMTYGHKLILEVKV